MAGRVRRVFDRYAARHLALQQEGLPLASGAGQITRIALHNGRLIVEGQTAAPHLVLDLAGRRRLWTQPGPQPGTQPGPQSGPQSGTQAAITPFRLELPFASAQPTLSYTWDGQPHSHSLPCFSARRLQAGRLALWPRFGAASLWALPSAVRWLRHHDLGARARVKQLLGLGAMVEDRPLDGAVFPALPPTLPPPPGGCAVTIVLPVYQGFDLLADVLGRVQRHTDLPWRLLLIDDASPDPRVATFLRQWVKAEPRATLLENPENLGFIGTMNRAFAHLGAQPGQDPVILLNADALVPQDWASRLVAPLLADPGVASVTPMSNDAELMGVPVICAPLGLILGAADRIDAVARRMLPDLPETPTGVGFCMALSPRYLAQVPQFDPAFGRGYGEEVDWCQKVRSLGGRHVCLGNLFVEHRGGTSFGSEAKQQLIRQNGARISNRYPQFDIEVQQFIADDPLLTTRLALGLGWAGSLGAGSSGAAVPVYLGHAMGGGAEHFLQHRIAADIGRLGAAVVLRVGGEYRWQIDLHSPAGVTRGCSNDRDLILRLLQILPRRDVIYSCGVGDPDPVALPDLLLDLAQGQRLEVMVHDYLTISPSYTLLDSNGVFHGTPSLQADAGKAGRSHRVQRPDGTWIGLAAWRKAWGAVLAEAAQVTVFSQDSANLMRAAYPDLGPDLGARLVLRPHQLRATLPRLAVRPGAAPVIGVLGNLGSHKGAGVLAALSQHLARDRSAGLVLLGNLDPAYDLRRPARVHGPYEVHDIPDLVARYGITCWLIPSVCPETFSFTTHEALSTGLPVICFDLGAQAEAVRRAMAEAGALGAVLALHNGRADPAALVEAAQRLSRMAQAAAPTD